MKKILCIMLVLFLAVCITGCFSKTPNKTETTKFTETTSPLSETQNVCMKKAGFELVQQTTVNFQSVCIYRHTLTDVLYVECSSRTDSSGLSVMMDSKTNGPLIYANWLKYQNGETVTEKAK